MSCRRDLDLDPEKARLAPQLDGYSRARLRSRCTSALAWWAPWQPGRFWGLTFGTIAAALFVNAGLYPLRRRLLAWPLGTVQRWLQLHIYGSVAARCCSC